MSSDFVDSIPGHVRSTRARNPSPMRRFRQPRSLPKSPKSWRALRWRSTLRRRSFRCWRPPCPTLRTILTCSSSCRLGWKVRSAVPAPKEGWRAGRQTAPLTRSAIGSDGRRSDTGQPRSDSRVTCSMSFANSPKRNLAPSAVAVGSQSRCTADRRQIAADLLQRPSRQSRAKARDPRICTWEVPPSGPLRYNFSRPDVWP